MGNKALLTKGVSMKGKKWKYRANFWRNTIDRVEITKETTYYVWLASPVGDFSVAKISQSEAFLGTFKEAKEAILAKIETRVKAAEAQLKECKAEYSKGLTLAPPN